MENPLLVFIITLILMVLIYGTIAGVIVFVSLSIAKWFGIITLMVMI